MNVIARSALLALASVPAMTAAQTPPTVRPEAIMTVAEGVSVIPDGRVPLVPNIGIIEGQDAILVVDTGIGPANGRLTLEAARKIAKGRKVYLTCTHFHPEHCFGASAFGRDGFILDRAQADEATEKSPGYVAMFAGLGPDVAKALQGIAFIQPSSTYTMRRRLNLGGRIVDLIASPAHTRGDQIVWVPDARVLFTGDLVENRFFPIFPDADSKGATWIAAIDRMRALRPRVVVPGHGAVAGPALLRTADGFLCRMRVDVAAAVMRGDMQAATAMTLKARYERLHPDWSSAMYLPMAVAVFYAEAAKKPPQIPGFDELK